MAQVLEKLNMANAAKAKRKLFLLKLISKTVHIYIKVWKILAEKCILAKHSTLVSYRALRFH